MAELNIKLNLEAQEVEAKIKKLEAEWERSTQKVDRQKQKVAELNKELEEYNNLLEEAKKRGGTISENKLGEELKKQLAEANSELKRLEANAELAGAKLNKELTPKTSIGGSIANTIKNIGNTAFEFIKKPFESIGNIFNNIKDSISGVISRIGKLAAYTFVFNVINQGFRDIRDLMSDFTSTNSEFSDSISRIRGNLLTAFQPIWETILPYLIQFVQWLENATAYVSAFISGIFGKSEQSSRDSAKQMQAQIQASKEASKALNNQKKNTDKLAKSTEKAGGSLAKFDELNVLSQDKENKGTSPKTTAGVGAAGVRAASVGEGGISFATPKIDTSSIEEYIQKVKEFLSPISEAFKKLYPQIEKLGSFVAQVLGDFWEKFLGPLGTYIITETIPHIMNSISESLERIDFSKITDALNKLWEALEPLAENALKGVVWILDKFLLPLAEWTVTDAIPNFLRTITNAIKILNTTLKVLKPILDHIYDKLIIPIADFLKNVFTDVMNDVNEILEYLNDVLEENKEDIEKVANFITDVLSVALVLFLSECERVFKTVKDIVKTSIEAIIGIIGSLIKSIAGIIDFVAGVFTGDWERAFRGLGNFIIGIFNSIIIAMNWAIKQMKILLNNLLGGVNTVIRGINLIPGVNIREVDYMDISKDTISSIPYLAQGAVIPPNSPFLAMLGDQRSGTNIEAPLDTIKQAFIEALNENGNYNNNGSYTFVAQLDGRTIFEETVRQNDMYMNQAGRSAFAY